MIYCPNTIKTIVCRPQPTLRQSHVVITQFRRTAVYDFVPETLNAILYSIITANYHYRDILSSENSNS